MEGELKSNFSKAGSDFRCDSLASFRQFCGQFLMKVLVETLKEATMPTTLSSWNPQPGKREGLGGIFDQAGPCPARERLVQVRKSDHSVFQRDGGYFFNSLSLVSRKPKANPSFLLAFSSVRILRTQWALWSVATSCVPKHARVWLALAAFRPGDPSNEGPGAATGGSASQGPMFSLDALRWQGHDL